jgi:hypothetical protein
MTRFKKFPIIRAYRVQRKLFLPMKAVIGLNIQTKSQKPKGL